MNMVADGATPNIHANFLLPQRIRVPAYQQIKRPIIISSPGEKISGVNKYTYDEICKNYGL